MPTNPLWLEHTERAAWDTVQMLRQQIETERARVEQLVRMQGSWPKMLEVLARLRTVHAIADEDPIAIVEQISAELVRVKQAQAELIERSQVETMQHQHERLMAVLNAPRQDATDSEALDDSFGAFLARVKEYAARATTKRSRSYERLLDELESRLDELEQAPRRERYEHAVALAYLAWRAARSSQERPRIEDG